MTKHLIHLSAVEPSEETCEGGNAWHLRQTKDGAQGLVETHPGGVGKTGTASPNSDQESLDDERGIMPAITSWLG